MGRLLQSGCGLPSLVGRGRRFALLPELARALGLEYRRWRCRIKVAFRGFRRFERRRDALQVLGCRMRPFVLFGSVEIGRRAFDLIERAVVLFPRHFASRVSVLYRFFMNRRRIDFNGRAARAGRNVDENWLISESGRGARFECRYGLFDSFNKKIDARGSKVFHAADGTFEIFCSIVDHAAEADGRSNIVRRLEFR